MHLLSLELGEIIIKLRERALECVVVIAACVLIYAVVSFYGGFAIVQGDSMEATLSDKDVVFTSQYNSQLPQYGDIIAFKVDLSNSGSLENGQQAPKYLVKRVIGVPSDRITISDGEVYRNNEKLVEPYILNNKTYIDTNVTVPENCLFVMGDNREISHDSRREDIGFINMNNVLGKVIFRLYPLNHFGKIK